MKADRQQAILRLIEQQELETQEQLLMELKRQGIACTQATISRDIKELRLVKEQCKDGRYKYVPSRQHTHYELADRLRTIFREGVTSFDLAQNIIVLKTMPGLANAAAAALDGMEIPDMVGSLAGDDTAILIMRTLEAAREFCDEIRQMVKR